MRVKSTEFFPNCLKEKNGAQGTPCFFLGKLQKNNAIAHCGKLYKENLRLDPVSGEVWIVAGWREGMGVHHVWVLGGGRVEGWGMGAATTRGLGHLQVSRQARTWSSFRTIKSL